MMRNLVDERITEQAAMYALGMLSQSEARTFERLLAASESEVNGALADELGAFESVVASFGLSAPEQIPPPSVREKLLSRIAAESGKKSKAAAPFIDPQFLNLRANEGEWSEISPGVLLKRLFTDAATGLVTSLYKLQPKTQAAEHLHPGVEQCYVLEGDFRVNDTILGPGDFHVAMPGSAHATVSTNNGTLLLIVAPEYYAPMG